MILIQYDLKKCPGVPFEIQPKEAIHHNLRGKLFLSAEFQTDLFSGLTCINVLVVLKVNGTLDRLVRIRTVRGYLIGGLFEMSKIVSKFD